MVKVYHILQRLLYIRYDINLNIQRKNRLIVKFFSGVTSGVKFRFDHEYEGKITKFGVINHGTIGSNMMSDCRKAFGFGWGPAVFDRQIFKSRMNFEINYVLNTNIRFKFNKRIPIFHDMT